ncbi:MAG: bacteriohemerythrin [Magnetovibrionaceae bacterium]
MGAVFDTALLESFRLGVPSIDEEHQAMAKTMEKVGKAIEAGDHPACAELLDELINISAAHFQSEEKFLAEIGYPGLDNHRAYHDEMLVKARSIKAICQSYGELDHLRNCYREMAGFLIDDIVKGDMAFKSFLETTDRIQKTD